MAIGRKNGLILLAMGIEDATSQAQKYHREMRRNPRLPVEPILRPAETLSEMLRTFAPAPLVTDDELRAFHVKDVNVARHEDLVSRLVPELEERWGRDRFKKFVYGRPGVGKSTEISRLLRRIGTKYEAVRFSAQSELSRTTFQPADVVLLMMIRVAERTYQETERTPSEPMLERVSRWFASEESVHTTEIKGSVEAAAGAGVKEDSLWNKVLNVFGTIKGEIKYGNENKTAVKAYRQARLSDLVSLANDFVQECETLLWTAKRREWLFVGEDFDKSGLARESVEALFVRDANLFTDLDAHLLFSIPTDLVRSQQGASVPNFGGHECVPDIPVFTKGPDPEPHLVGRDALREVVAHRAQEQLFKSGVVERLIVGSGGVLRDLFSLQIQATTQALAETERNPTRVARITAEDARYAIARLRDEYRSRLGDSPYNPYKVSYEEQRVALLDIYKASPEANIRDDALLSLLATGAVLQLLNGEERYMVHSLIVDVLKEQGHLPERAKGGTGDV